MTANSKILGQKRKSQAPPAFKDRLKLLPLNIQNEIKTTQQEQLFDFYEAML